MPQPPPPPHRRIAAVVVTLAGVLAPLAWGPPAGAQLAGPGATSTTSVQPSATPTTAVTTAPPEPSDTPVPTNAPAAPVAPTAGTTSTTTTAPASWAAKVPGPPAPAPVAASAADIARANQLERQIVTQSDVLDVLAAQYDQAQQKVASTAADVDSVRGRLAAARGSAEVAQAHVADAEETLRAVAVDAYVNLGAGFGGPADSAGLVTSYERGNARADAETAMGKALGQLQQLHQAEQQLQVAEKALVDEVQRASDANAAAQSAAAAARAAAQAAGAQQQQLLATVDQVHGNLVQLVAAAQAAEAQAAFNRFSTSGSLDFMPAAALSGPSALAATAVRLAVAQVGKPYVYGAAGPASFDCSGLMQWAWAQIGVALPRVAADQQAWATPVPISQLAPGDLVFFGSPAHHVGMYVGYGQMVDAPHSGAAVSVVPIWWDDLAGFGRVH